LSWRNVGGGEVGPWRGRLLRQARETSDEALVIVEHRDRVVEFRNSGGCVIALGLKTSASLEHC
jgi:hypothetical protein